MTPQRKSPPIPAFALSLAFLLVGISVPAAAQPPQAYQQPSAEMRAVLDAPGLPARSLSPDQRTLARIGLQRHRSMAELARPVLRLAGTRIDPAASGPQLVTRIESISLQSLAAPDAMAREVALPAGGGFHQMRWSPDGRRFLLNRRTAGATELWVGDVATAVVRPLPGVRLNGILSGDVAWLGADQVVVLAVPDGRGPAPVVDTPQGPAIQESMGLVSPERTLQDLLQDGQDEALFAHHAIAALRRVWLDTGASRQIGTPGLYASLQALGTAGLLMTERLVPPFSYRVGWQGFAREVAVHDGDGRLLRELGRTRLRQGVPVRGVITGPRSHQASPLADGAVYWVEALDGGDPRIQAPHRDRLMRLDAPYRGDAVEVHRTAGRLSGINFLEGDAHPRATVAEIDLERQRLSVDLLSLDGRAPPRRLQDRALRDRYGDPGTPLTRVLPSGRTVVRVDGGDSLLLAGPGAGPQGDRPFIDRLRLADGQAARLFQSGLSHLERPLDLLADGRLLTVRESFAEPPNLVLRSGPGLAKMQALTNDADPTPQLRGVRRERVKFTRADGVALSFWLYLPPGHRAGDRRATLVWAYPQEFTDGDTAGQVSGAENRFGTFSGMSPLMLLLDGHVVLMNATMPVVGDPLTVNDSFVEQITENARAIVDKAVAMGVSDPGRMVVGGHSYGAFMAVNLLAHTDLFRAGIARSGAYNRTLTPFGFQAERRTFWEAPDVYQRLSPFNFAHRLKEPLLLIHGDSDNNPGTFPMQSERLYQALAGTGGRVRYVSLPHESHGYSARESLGHMLREMSDWMKRHTGDPQAAE